MLHRVFVDVRIRENVQFKTLNNDETQYKN
jgi:hypothetical protein